MPEFYLTFAKKYFFPKWGKCPLPLISYAYAERFRRLCHQPRCTDVLRRPSNKPGLDARTTSEHYGSTKTQERTIKNVREKGEAESATCRSHRENLISADWHSTLRCIMHGVMRSRSVLSRVTTDRRQTSKQQTATVTLSWTGFRPRLWQIRNPAIFRKSDQVRLRLDLADASPVQPQYVQLITDKTITQLSYVLPLYSSWQHCWPH